MQGAVLTGKINITQIDPTLFESEKPNLIIQSPKQLEFEKINSMLACKLNSEWHSRLPYIHWSNVVRNTHSICIGAKFNFKWYAVGIWSSPVAQNRFTDGKKILELRRLAISPEAPKNTASRMISRMIEMIKKEFPEIERLISYQDTEVHNGTIYKASNWFASSESNGISWSNKNRKRNKEQTLAKKVRWEFMIKKNHNKTEQTL